MTWIIWGVGCVAVVAISMATIATSVGWIADAIAKWQDRNDKKTRELAACDLGNDMLVNSYWFSEDKATMNLLKSIGNALMRSRCCSFDPNKIRDEWRQAKAAATSSESTGA